MELIPIWCASFSIFAKLQELKNILVPKMLLNCIYKPVLLSCFAFTCFHCGCYICKAPWALLSWLDTGTIQVYIIIIIMYFRRLLYVGSFVIQQSANHWSSSLLFLTSERLKRLA